MILKNQIEEYNLRRKYWDDEQIEESAIKLNVLASEAFGTNLEIPLNLSNFNTYSIQLLKSGYRALNYFNRNSQLGIDEDYSAPGIQFAKVYENEFRISLVYWLEKLLSQSNQLTLGRAQFLAWKERNSHMPNQLRSVFNEYVSFLQKWKTINRMRNVIAHASKNEDLVTREDVDGFLSQLQYLNDDSSFKKIYDLKLDNGTYS